MSIRSAMLGGALWALCAPLLAHAETVPEPLHPGGSPTEATSSERAAAVPDRAGVVGTVGRGPGTSPSVALEQLLKLPSSLDYSVPKRGGATASEWRDRFGGARSALDAEREALAAARRELETVAGSSEAWQVGPPIPGGGGASDAPLDYRLRQQIRRHRSAVDGLERQLRELEVEANLAGVPEEWRQ